MRVGFIPWEPSAWGAHALHPTPHLALWVQMLRAEGSPHLLLQSQPGHDFVVVDEGQLVYFLL